MKSSFKLTLSLSCVAAAIISINLFYLCVKDSIPYLDNVLRNGNYEAATLYETDSMEIKNNALINGWTFVGSTKEYAVNNEYVIFNDDQDSIITNKLSKLGCRFARVYFKSANDEEINITLKALDKDGNIIESSEFISRVKNAVFEYKTEYFHKNVAQFMLSFNKKSPTNQINVTSFKIYNVL